MQIGNKYYEEEKEKRMKNNQERLNRCVGHNQIYIHTHTYKGVHTHSCTYRGTLVYAYSCNLGYKHLH